MSMDAADQPAVCRDYLGTLLGEESNALRELEELLLRENEVLAARNVAAIERTAVIRQQMMGELARIEEQRRSLCRMHGHAPDWLGLENLMRWCDPNGTVLPRLRECAQRAMRCRDLNDRNGTLVAARLHQVEDMLVALGSAARPMTYGPTGVSTSLGAKKRELGAA